MLRRLDYQDRVLETLDAYLDILSDEKRKADEVAKLIAERPELGIPQRDFAAESWHRIKSAGKLPTSRAEIPYSRRVDGTGRPVPDLVLKVPTAGGKTFLAVSSLSQCLGVTLAEILGLCSGSCRMKLFTLRPSVISLIGSTRTGKHWIGRLLDGCKFWRRPIDWTPATSTINFVSCC